MRNVPHDIMQAKRPWGLNPGVVMGGALVAAVLAISLVGIARTLGSQGAAVAQAGPGPVGLQASTVLQTTTTAIGQPVQFPASRNQWTVVMLEIAPGGRVGRHLHPVPNLVYVLEGEITIEADGHPARTYRPGQAFAESVDHWHDGLNRGTTAVKVLVVFAGEDGKPVTVRP
jgi:quercetin dioxygenase-like cupin family protein